MNFPADPVMQLIIHLAIFKKGGGPPLGPKPREKKKLLNVVLSFLLPISFRSAIKAINTFRLSSPD